MPMKIEKAIKRLIERYHEAEKNEHIRDKVAWALYHVWAEADGARAEQPSEVTEQRRHGHWMRPDDMFVSDCSTRFWCSVCGKHANYHHGQNSRKYKTLPAKCGYAYCPHCGAKMDGEEQ